MVSSLLTHHSRCFCVNDILILKQLVERHGVRFGNGFPPDYSTFFEEHAAAFKNGDSKKALMAKTAFFMKHFDEIDKASLNFIKRANEFLLANVMLISMPKFTFIQAFAMPLAVGVARRLRIPVIGVFDSPVTPSQCWPFPPLGGAFGWTSLTNKMSYASASTTVWPNAMKSKIIEWHVKRVGVTPIAAAEKNTALILEQDVPIMYVHARLYLSVSVFLVDMSQFC